MLVNVGDVLAGKYRVDKVLGMGGMGMVVAAMHLELDQKVAIKLMLPDAAADADATDRFLREAKACVRLRGEHVCKVFDVGRLDTGAPYIVMEHLAGQDFQATIKRRAPLPPAEAIDHVLQAIEGVAEAHANGIVHRDLKPANLFVSTDNDGSALVKVLDFGISKVSSAGGVSTKTGDIMGSPAYMAPEQMVSSKNVDARADQWALGVILYQALTNRVPFTGDTLPTLCMQVLNEQPPPLSTVRKDLPADLCAAVEKCLAKEPAQRHADVAVLAAAIAPFGGPDATAQAKRIAKVLRRSGAVPVEQSAADMSGVAATQMGTDPTVMPVSANAPATPAAPRSLAEKSSISGAAGEMVSPPPKRRLGLMLGLGGTVAAGAVIAIIALTGGSEKKSDPAAPVVQQPAAQPPAPPPPAPVVKEKEKEKEPPPPLPEHPVVTEPPPITQQPGKPPAKKTPEPKTPEPKFHALETKPAQTAPVPPVDKAAGAPCRHECMPDEQRDEHGCCKPKKDLSKTLVDDPP